MKFLKQGAEAVISLDGNTIVKERVKKDYRISEIDDKLRKSRTRQEVKLLKKVENAPKVIDFSEKDMKIVMEFIDGPLLKDVLDYMDKKKRENTCIEIGKCVGSLHKQNIIHGDLTTSNMMLNGDKVIFIDFGLGFNSIKNEDKAVDLNLLKHALESRHHEHFDDSFNCVLKGYKQSYELAEEVLSRLEKVDARGRYKGKKQ
ncbi:MAG: KEOPS complex kinase/ATPase Bud32 [Candidatus Nanoarchaeia archaeon]|nr:KEOPS complex kinase/ATPase Bud32 [Candidatus Nanoarchaeia archaeon]